MVLTSGTRERLFAPADPGPDYPILQWPADPLSPHAGAWLGSCFGVLGAGDAVADGELQRGLGGGGAQWQEEGEAVGEAVGRAARLARLRTRTAPRSPAGSARTHSSLTLCCRTRSAKPGLAPGCGGKSGSSSGGGGPKSTGSRSPSAGGFLVLKRSAVRGGGGAAGSGTRGRSASQKWRTEVQGWGKTDPLARFQLQNQAKKCKANDTSNNCQFCLDMLPSIDNGIGQEAKTTRNQSKSEGQLSVDAIADTASEKEEISTHSSKSVVLQDTALKWKYVTSYTVQTFQGEMKNPPIKRILYVEPGRCEKSRSCKA
ncbi:uncharacterized protein LJ206_013137 [Theristicus caerulescens]